VDLVYYANNGNENVISKFITFAESRDYSLLLSIFRELVSIESEWFMTDLMLIESCNYAHFTEADKGINFTQNWAYWYS